MSQLVDHARRVTQSPSTYRRTDSRDGHRRARRARSSFCWTPQARNLITKAWLHDIGDPPGVPA